MTNRRNHKDSKRRVTRSFWLILCLVLLVGCGDARSGEAQETEGIQQTGAESVGLPEPTDMDTADSDVLSDGSTDGTPDAIAGINGAEALPGDNGGTTPDAIGTDTPAQEEPIDEPEPPSISLIMVGDMLLHTPVEKSALQEDGSYNFDALFTHTAEDIGEADLALVNQEVIIGGEELGISGYPSFNAPYAVGDALVKAGFNVVCHGTNHALDKRKKGLMNCLDFWRNTYPQIEVLGIHDSPEDRDAIYIYEKDGIRVAILNYTYSTNGVAMPEDMPFAVDMLEQEQVVADIQRAEELADFTIVCPHWGTEYLLEVSSSQKKWTKIFLENGVDLVLGTHPHVIEPIEWVKDEETGREMLVYYSLGNYVNWTSSSGEGIANRMVGGMAQVTLGVDEAGETVIQEYGVMPLVAHLEEGIGGVTVYPLEEYTEELAAKNQIIKQDSAFSLSYCQELCGKVWADLY